MNKIILYILLVIVGYMAVRYYLKYSNAQDALKKCADNALERSITTQ